MKLIKEAKLELKNKTVYVFLDSNSLGDNLCWMPQIERFRKITGCKLLLTTFFNFLFKEQYPDIIWNDPGTILKDFDYQFSIGYNLSDDMYNKSPIDPRTIPLGQIPCEILGIPHEEVRPKLKTGFPRDPELTEKYVCIATMSTAGAKLWHRENGWSDVIEYLRSIGLETVIIQKESSSLLGTIDRTGDIPLENRMGLLEHCEFFIGLGSGLSWLAWGMEKPVILISGFSDTFAEFQLDCERIINKTVCNSCWNDTSVIFDKGDWNWCPRHKDTDRQFECSKKISAEQVIKSINKFI